MKRNKVIIFILIIIILGFGAKMYQFQKENNELKRELGFHYLNPVHSFVFSSGEFSNENHYLEHLDAKKRMYHTHRAVLSQTLLPSSSWLFTFSVNMFDDQIRDLDRLSSDSEVPDFLIKRIIEREKYIRDVFKEVEDEIKGDNLKAYYLFKDSDSIFDQKILDRHNEWYHK